MHGKSVFNESWLSDEQFKALTSHFKNNNYQVNVKNFNPVFGLFFKSNSTKPSSSKNTSNNKN